MAPAPAALYSLYLMPEQWMRYAGIWRRLAAAIIDTVMLAFMLFAVSIVAVVFLVALPLRGQVLQTGLFRLAAAALALLIAWAYSAGFECSAGQGTIGKATLGVAGCDAEGQRIGFGRASLRFVGKLLTCLTLGAGFVLIAFDRRKRGLDDRLAGTVVIQRDPFAAVPPIAPLG